MSSLNCTGLFTANDVQDMVAEITKMKDFQHPNVMTLIGVCLDAGPGVSIVMPFMANGSLLDYLKNERKSLFLSENSEIDDVRSIKRIPYNASDFSLPLLLKVNNKAG